MAAAVLTIDINARLASLEEGLAKANRLELAKAAQGNPEAAPPSPRSESA